MELTSKPGSTKKTLTGGWRTYAPLTDLEKCIGCGTCAKVCPESCIEMKSVKGKQTPITDLDFCKGCGLCAAECPVKCIEMKLEKK